MKKIIPFLIVIALSTCSKDKTIYFKTENAEGLSQESFVRLNGIEIGAIDNIELNQQGQILIKSSIKTEINIPTDSEFTISDSSLLGPKIIELKLGKSKKTISENDTVNLKAERTLFPGDSLTDGLKKLMNTITGSDKNDSILNELKRLNKNLEKQQNQK